MAKIANPDRSVMDRLYASEVSKLAPGSKMAAEKQPGFDDHKEFETTLADILSSDGKSEFNLSGDPNGVLND